MEKHEFKPKEWVLVRDEDRDTWKLDIFSHFVDGASFPYICIGSYYIECIPFEGNEALIGTTDAPEEKPNEEFKFGDWVEVLKDGEWTVGIVTEVDEDDEFATYHVNFPEDEGWYSKSRVRKHEKG